jgi:hypothetical protein
MARPPSKSYLLRLWREHESAPQRVTLIDVGQPDRARHFATLEALFACLRAEPSSARDLPDTSDTAYCTED